MLNEQAKKAAGCVSLHRDLDGDETPSINTTVNSQNL